MAADNASEIAEIRSKIDRLVTEVQDLQSRVEVLESGDVLAEADRPGKRVLVCDDTRLVRALIKGILSGAGYRVTEAENGQEALDLLDEQAFDLVIVDIHMPDVDGAELLKGLRIAQSNVDLPVVICSGSRDRKDYVRVSQYGVQGVLQKPIKKDELLDCIAEVLAESKSLADGGNRAIFDPESALNRVGGDTDLLHEIIADFLEDWPTTLAAVRKAVQDGSAEALAQSSHAIKGALSSLSAHASAAAAADLERMARSDNTTNARAGYSELEKEVHKLKDELESFNKPKR